jgi:O-antigen/teichoic acid export membrane protein
MESLSYKQQRRNVRIGILISYLTLAVSVLTTLKYQPFLLSSIGDEQYGINSFASSITSWLGVLSFGLATTYVRFAVIAEKQEGEDGVKKINGFYLSVFSIVTIISFFIGIIIWCLFYFRVIPLDNYSEFDKDLIYKVLAISVCSVSIGFVASFFPLYETYKYRFIWIRTLDLLTRVLNVGITVLVLLSSQKNVVIVALISALVSLFISILHLLYCFFVLKIKFSKCKENEELRKMTKEILFFSFWVFLNSIIDQINANSGKVILGFMTDPKENAVTIFSLGQELYGYAAVAVSGVSTAYVPDVMTAAAKNDKDEINRIFLKVSFAQIIIICWIVGGFCSCGSEFVDAWIGPDRHQVFYIALSILIVGIVPFSECIAVDIQRAFNKHKFRSVFYLAMALLNLIITPISVWLLPVGQKVYGPVIGFVSTFFAGNWIAINIFYKKHLGLPVGKYLMYLAIVLSYSAVSCLIVYLIFQYFHILANANLWLQVFTEGSVYSILFFAFTLAFFWKKVWPFIKSKIHKKEEAGG